MGSSVTVVRLLSTKTEMNFVLFLLCGGWLGVVAGGDHMIYLPINGRSRGVSLGSLYSVRHDDFFDGSSLWSPEDIDKYKIISLNTNTILGTYFLPIIAL